MDNESIFRQGTFQFNKSLQSMGLIIVGFGSVPEAVAEKIFSLVDNLPPHYVVVKQEWENKPITLPYKPLPITSDDMAALSPIFSQSKSSRAKRREDARKKGKKK